MLASNRGRTRTRTALLTGSSLALALFIGGGLSLTPATAHAANECGDPAANGVGLRYRF